MPIRERDDGNNPATGSSLSTAREVVDQSMHDKVVGVQFSDTATYCFEGRVYSAFQNDEVLMKIKFESGVVMLTKLARNLRPTLEPADGRRLHGLGQQPAVEQAE